MDEAALLEACVVAAREAGAEILKLVERGFEVETKKSILRQAAQLLRPEGYLVLGGAETTLNLEDSFRRSESLKGGFYQLVG